MNRSFFVRSVVPASVLFLSFAASQFAGADTTSLEAAKLLYEQGDDEAARKAFEQLVRADAQNADARFHLGGLALRRGDFKSAIKHLEQAVKLAPEVSDYQRSLGDAYAAHAKTVNPLSGYGLARKSKRAYEAAVAADPESVAARWSLMDYCRMVPGFIGGSMDEAYEHATAIEKVDPPMGRWARAMVMLSDDKPGNAIALYDDALQADPPDYTALLRFGSLTHWTGMELDRGMLALDRCLTLTAPADQGGHERVHFSRGQIFEQKGQADAARDAYKAALEIDPTFSRAAEALASLD